MTLPQDISSLQSKMSAAVRAHWKAFLFEGVLLTVLGLAAIIVPPLASLAVTIFLGWMFLVSGIAGLALTFWARQMPGFWWSLVSAVLASLVLVANYAFSQLSRFERARLLEVPAAVGPIRARDAEEKRTRHGRAHGEFAKRQQVRV